MTIERNMITNIMIDLYLSSKHVNLFVSYAKTPVKLNSK